MYSGIDKVRLPRLIPEVGSTDNEIRILMRQSHENLPSDSYHPWVERKEKEEQTKTEFVNLILSQI